MNYDKTQFIISIQLYKIGVPPVTIPKAKNQNGGTFRWAGTCQNHWYWSQNVIGLYNLYTLVYSPGRKNKNVAGPELFSNHSKLSVLVYTN